MQSQGWIPGSTLGATSANSNSDTGFPYTKIKKAEGKCGVGSSHQSQYDDSHCLDALQEIFGRLNGKPGAKCAAATTVSRELKTVDYVESRWRVLKFVSGGLLVGAKPEEYSERRKKTSSPPVTQSMTTCDASADERSDIGIDRMNEQESMESESHSPCESREYHQKSMSRSANLASSKSHDRKRKSEAGEPTNRKKKKRAKNKTSDLKQSKRSSSEETLLAEPPTPTVESQTTPVKRSSLSSRHAVRIRYIKHKKMVMKDIKALNEVCSIDQSRN